MAFLTSKVPGIIPVTTTYNPITAIDPADDYVLESPTDDDDMLFDCVGAMQSALDAIGGPNIVDREKAMVLQGSITSLKEASGIVSQEEFNVAAFNGRAACIYQQKLAQEGLLDSIWKTIVMIIKRIVNGLMWIITLGKSGKSKEESFEEKTRQETAPSMQEFYEKVMDATESTLDSFKNKAKATEDSINIETANAIVKGTKKKFNAPSNQQDISDADIVDDKGVANNKKASGEPTGNKDGAKENDGYDHKNMMDGIEKINKDQADLDKMMDWFNEDAARQEGNGAAADVIIDNDDFVANFINTLHDVTEKQLAGKMTGDESVAKLQALFDNKPEVTDAILTVTGCGNDFRERHIAYLDKTIDLINSVYNKETTLNGIEKAFAEIRALRKQFDGQNDKLSSAGASTIMRLTEDKYLDQLLAEVKNHLVTQAKLRSMDAAHFNKDASVFETVPRMLNSKRENIEGLLKKSSHLLDETSHNAEKLADLLKKLFSGLSSYDSHQEEMDSVMKQVHDEIGSYERDFKAKFTGLLHELKEFSAPYREYKENASKEVDVGDETINIAPMGAKIVKLRKAVRGDLIEIASANLKADQVYRHHANDLLISMKALEGQIEKLSSKEGDVYKKAHSLLSKALVITKDRYHVMVAGEYCTGTIRAYIDAYYEFAGTNLEILRRISNVKKKW